MKKLFFYMLFFLFPALSLAAEEGPMCLEFNGIDQYVLINNANLNLNRYMTLECWFRVDEFVPDAGLIDNGKSSDDGSSFRGYGVYSGEPGSIYVRVGNGSRDTSVTVDNIPAGCWQHLAFTYDRFKKDENIVVFINGKVRAKGDFATAITYPVYMNSYGLFLGKSYNGFDNRFFRGCLDEVRIWSRVRSNAEIRRFLCEEPDSLENTLQGYYNFNQTGGTSLSDLSGKGNHGTLVNYSDTLRPLSYAQLLPMQPDDVGFDRIVLYWASSPAYERYTVDLSTDSLFALSLVPYPLTDITTYYHIVDGLEPGTYYFRVKGHYAGADPALEPWSPVRRTATVSDVATPICLTHFSAVLDGDDVLVDWTTESQTEHARFYLQRRGQGSAWEIRSVIAGEGTTSETLRYRFRDSEILPGKTYDYRLLSLSYSDTWDSSAIRTVRVPGKAVFALGSLYPNPFNPEFSLRLHMRYPAEIRIRIFSLDGRCVAVLHEGYLDSGPQHFSWKAGDIPAGIYLLELCSGTQSESHKLLYIK